MLDPTVFKCESCGCDLDSNHTSYEDFFCDACCEADDPEFEDEDDE